jgi:hypothetical protein
MSTKTTFKRIALVAVAALGLSVLSVAPSTAAADTFTLGATTSDATTAVAVTNTISLSAIAANGTTGETLTATVVLLSAPATSTAAGILPVVSITATQSAAGVNADSSTAGGVLNVWAKAGGRYTAAGTITVTPDVPGVYVYRITPSGVGALTTAAQTWTVTAVAPTVKSTTAFLNTVLGSPSTADASSFAFPAAASVTARGRLTVQQYSTTDTATPATTPISQAVVVAIDKGLVSATDGYFTGAKSVTTAAATAGPTNYYVFSNGDVGTASLTVTVGGVLVSTKTITFQGVATTLSAALATNAASWIAPTGTTTVNVTAKDSAGNAAVSLPTTMTATPASTAIATATINSTTGVVTITGVAAGTTVITIADSATTTPAASATYTVTVAPALSATLPTLTFDKAEYAAGELMTITVGAAAADNATFAAFTAAGVASSVNLVTVKNPFAVSTSTVALVAGKATWTAYAPITAGPITLTAMSGAGVVSTVTSAEVKATATVVSDGVAQAAVDAATEALDAAYAATDAANAAAEAADAATAAAQDAADAVEALATQVATYISNLRKQITALTNLVIKIQKKVRA